MIIFKMTSSDFNLISVNISKPNIHAKCYIYQKNMIRQFSAFLLIVAASTGCQHPKVNSSTAKVASEELKSGILETRLSALNQTLTKDSVMLSFTVVNHADSAQRFVKWETPFEPRLGKYLDVINEQGTEAEFTGAMARRMMPPPAEAYIEVAAHDSVSTTFNAANNYTIASGQYTVKYVGGGVSGLDAGNEIKITVAN